jgi:hypothetical protein
MQAHPNFLLRSIGDMYFILPDSQTVFLSAGQMLTTNETGAYLWDCLQEDCSLDSLTEKLQAYYEIDRQTATEDVRFFLDALKKIHALLF